MLFTETKSKVDCTRIEDESSLFGQIAKLFGVCLLAVLFNWLSPTTETIGFEQQNLLFTVDGKLYAKEITADTDIRLLGQLKPEWDVQEPSNYDVYDIANSPITDIGDSSYGFFHGVWSHDKSLFVYTDIEVGGAQYRLRKYDALTGRIQDIVSDNIDQEKGVLDILAWVDEQTVLLVERYVLDEIVNLHIWELNIESMEMTQELTIKNANLQGRSLTLPKQEMAFLGFQYSSHQLYFLDTNSRSIVTLQLHGELVQETDDTINSNVPEHHIHRKRFSSISIGTDQEMQSIIVELLSSRTVTTAENRPDPFLFWPLDDHVRNITRYPDSPWTSEYNMATYGGHQGTDVAGSDFNIYAAANGWIVDIYDYCTDPITTENTCLPPGASVPNMGLYNWGNSIRISHTAILNGNIQQWYTAYAHLKSNSVPSSLEIGDVVNVGEFLGLSGDTGRSNGPHLHFEVRNLDVYTGWDDPWGSSDYPHIKSLWVGGNSRPISAQNAISYENTGQIVPSVENSLLAGTTYEIEFHMRNDGLVPWRKGEAYLSHLSPDTSDPSPLWRYGLQGWGDDNTGRRIELSEDVVNVGEEGTFRATIYVPAPENNNFTNNQRFTFNFYANGFHIPGESPWFELNSICNDDGQFCDVPIDENIFASYIQFAEETDITRISCGENFNPKNIIPRSQAALMLARWLNFYVGDDLENWPIKGTFPDLENDPTISDDVKRAAEFLQVHKVFEGRPIDGGDKWFFPHDPLKRDELTKVVIRVLEAADADFSYASLDNDELYFDDHESISGSLLQFILTARKLGIVDGYSNGEFRPSNWVTREQFVKLLATAAYFEAHGTAIPDITSVNKAQYYDLYLKKLWAGGKEACGALDSARNSSSQNSNVPICVLAAAGTEFPNLSISENRTLACYYPQDDTYHLIEDVPPDYQFANDIKILFATGVTNGCADSQYCPEAELKRQDLVVMMLRLLHYIETGESGLNYVPPEATVAHFQDVPLGTEIANFIYDAYDRGLINGYEGNFFRPEYSASRVDIAIVILRALYGPDVLDTLPTPLSIFEDARFLLEYEQAAIEELYWLGITRGCGTTSIQYCPTDAVLRGQAAALIVRAFIAQPNPTNRVGDVCFSTKSDYLLSELDAWRLGEVDDGDVVCYHQEANIFKMFFNASNHNLAGIDIDAISIGDNEEFWFSTKDRATVPTVGDVEDEDIILFHNGQFSLHTDGSNYSTLGNEDIDALHFFSNSELYFSTTGSADFGFDVDDEDILLLNKNGGQINPFWNPQPFGISQDVDGVSIVSQNANDTRFFLTFDNSAVLPTESAPLTVDQNDIVLYEGESGENPVGMFELDVCFDLDQFTDGTDINGLYVDMAWECAPEPDLPDPPDVDEEEPETEEFVLQVAPQTLSFTVTEGDGETTPATISVINAGSAQNPLSWTADFDATWLQLSNSSGQSPASIEVTADATGLVVGSYTESILIASEQTDSLVVVNVTLNVEAGVATEPLVLTADSGHTNIQLSWSTTNDPAVTSYRIQRTISGTLAYTPITSVSETVYIDDDENLTSGVGYCYEVEALRDDLTVATRSNQACATLDLLELWAQGDTAAQGETGTVRVGVANANALQIDASDIWLDFDSSVISFVSITNTVLTEDYVWAASVTPQGGNQSRVKISLGTFGNSAAALYDDGALFELEFQVVGADGISTLLDLRDFIVAQGGGSTVYAPDDLFNSIPLSLIDGTFLVDGTIAYTRGDVNGNGVVETVDALIAFRIFEGTYIPSSVELLAADVNTDGQIDQEDVTLITNYALYQTWPTVSDVSKRFLRTPLDGSFSIDNTLAYIGEQATTSIRTTGLSGIGGCSLVIPFNTKVIREIVDVSAADELDELDLIYAVNEAGLLTIGFASQVPVSLDGELLSIDMNISPDAPQDSNWPLTIAEARCHDPSGRDVERSILQGNISITNGRLQVAADPLLSLSSNSYQAEIDVLTPTSQRRYLTVNNSGTGAFEWVATVDQDWLTLDKYSGEPFEIVELIINPVGLPVGTHTATVTFRDIDDASNSQTATIEVVVEPVNIYLPLVSQ